ncbi:MAG: flagellar biosynthesis protein FliQ [Acidiphilium sp. 37-64-53]|jgi:flagellar biosynthetic protein FliQ|uniref:flagellar biosynthetic protein FliQ n=1 Tax=Acidiphilium TaxID=522 RepID=UPI000BD678DF|nr:MULTISPECIES: flagellar biosynthetic protein FliQ [Acidiphilium]OYW03203.1 MAG: flagellar biosynthesis protein FliQ [Acidiphilium sp. 37-64-53]OZB30867.1 MAG: flagellar biosynthesis protein FliQ [Acidiphilium sp. 34-64-41]HQT84139.1 flagellar biosynthetic protein FliQ [Acidiphilium rubrum]
MPDPSIAIVLHEALYITARLAAPPLLASLATGLIISVLQSVTQINEPSLIFLPKVVAVAGAVMMLGGYAVTLLTEFSHNIFSAMVHVG